MSIFSPFWILWRLFRASPSLQVAISAAVAGGARVLSAAAPATAWARRETAQHRKRNRPESRRFWNSAPFLHDPRATLADRRKHIQHGGADFQKHLAAMADDLARRLKQPPAHRLYLRTRPI